MGKATKYINLISDKKIKEYVAVAKLGIHTDSYDITGEVLEEKQVENIADEKIIETLNSFLGKQEQTPPIFSAKKVVGKRLYSYAHEKKEVKIRKQNIEIFF